MVSLNGDYVHSREAQGCQDGWFEVIAGRSTKAGGAAKRFAFVHCYDTHPRRRLCEVLKAQELQANQTVTFLSDGGDTVRDLPLDLYPQAEHFLDWFHWRGFAVLGLIGGIAPLMGYAAFSLGLVGYVSALFKLSAVFTLAWAYLLLGECDVPRRLPGALVMLAGAALIGG